MKPVDGLKEYGNRMMSGEQSVKDLIKIIINEYGFKECTIIGPGKAWENFVYDLNDMINIKHIYDKDPALKYTIPYTVADAIFDDVEVSDQLILSLHAEKHYPATRMWKGYHIMVIDQYYSNHDPTTKDTLDEENWMEIEKIGDYLVYHGEVK